MKKNFSKFSVLLFGLFIMQACSWGGPKIVTMEIAYKSGPLPPDYYQEAVMDVTPDYGLRTIAIGYKSDFPMKANKLPEDAFRGDATIGGEYFDRFIEFKKIFEEQKEPEADGTCVGGSEFFVTAKMTDGKELSKSIYSCGDKIPDIAVFYGDVVGMLTKNVY